MKGLGIGLGILGIVGAAAGGIYLVTLGTTGAILLGVMLFIIACMMAALLAIGFHYKSKLVALWQDIQKS